MRSLFAAVMILAAGIAVLGQVTMGVRTVTAEPAQGHVAGDVGQTVEENCGLVKPGVAWARPRSASILKMPVATRPTASCKPADCAEKPEKT